jgi:hypothetical protein
MKRSSTKRSDVVIQEVGDRHIHGLKILVYGKEIFLGNRNDVDMWTLKDVVNALGHSYSFVKLDDEALTI